MRFSQKLKRGFVAAVAATAIIMLIPRTTALIAQCGGCYVEQSEGPIEEGNCATETYDLQYYVNYTYGDYNGDAGWYTVSGACYVYTDCDCNYHSGATPGYITPDNEPDGFGDLYFWWDALNVTEYSYNSCASGSCQSNGVHAQEIDYENDYISYSSWYCDC